MITGLRAVWRGVRHLNHRGYIYIWANVLWLVCSLPLVTAPAAWAGLVHMSHLAHEGPTANIRDFWDGFRANLRRGLLLALLNALVIVVNISNLIAYQHMSGVEFVALRVFWVTALLLWFAFQLYLWPLYYHMETPTLRGAARNALVMMTLNPLFTLGLWLGILLIAAVSTFLAASWFLLTGSLIAAISVTAVRDRLIAGGYKKPSPDVV
ncbi:MAG: DUF624 domain-containing protein [Anaerolineae bacterium]|nr:DUF624 domain-containing protein [Anaerolineae bacterium]